VKGVTSSKHRVGQMSVGRTVFDRNSAALSFLLKFDTVR
jgi:hypothetical protein